MIWPLRKTAAAAPLESQRALDALPRPAWLRGADLALTWVNAAYARALGEDAATIIAGQKELLRHSSDADGRSLARGAQKNKAPATALRHVVIDGERRLLLVTEQPLAQGYFGFALDQTKTEELETELARTRSAEAQVLQNLVTAVAIFGADQKLNFYNPSFLSITRLTTPQLDGQPTFTQVVNAMREAGRLPEFPDFRRAREAWQAWFTNLIAPHEELLHLLDNTTLHLLVTPHPAGGLMIMLEDITDRLALEAAYNTQIAVQRETLDNLREGTVLLGSDGRVRLWNPAFQTIWNLPPEAVQVQPHWRELAKNLAVHFVPDSWAAAWENLVTMPLSHTEIEESYMLVDGRVIEFAAEPLPDGAMLLRFLDATDKAKLTAALRDRADALEAADRMKSEFLYNVSYQLRTPLNTITGFAEVMKLPSSGDMNDRQASYMQHILDAADDLVILIDNLLALSSIQAGQVEIAPAPVDVYQLLVQIQTFAETIAHAKRQRIILAADIYIGTYQLDEARIKQVLLNLLSNALKYAPPDTPVTLGARRDVQDGKSSLLLWVRDEGPGIPAAEQSRIFLPFERTNRKGAGAGIGLALARSLVQLHGGEIKLISTEGQGTEVRCYIPI